MNEIWQNWLYGIIAGLSFGFAIGFNVSQYAFGEELPCVLFSDGKLAIIKNACDGYGETISWFLYQDYHIDAAAETHYQVSHWGRVFMSR